MSKRKAMFFKKSISYDIPIGNIISFWRFEGNPNDEVGGRTLVLTDGATYATGITGQSGDVTPSSSAYFQYNLVADTGLDFGNGVNDIPFTWSTLVKFSSTGGNQYIIDRRSAAFAGRICWFLLGSGGNFGCTFFDESTDGSISASFPFVPTLDQWYHVGLTYDGNSVNTGMTLYLDGIDVTTGYGGSGSYVAMENASTNLIIGKYRQDTTASLDGFLDEMVYFNIKLTALQMLDLANAQLAGVNILTT